ncbi:MAG: hypothetical protein MZV64_12570 [Ignavibacteriales bacterium]|nr:hypothetical protein [Ignavibacteriales bacterium]
MAMSTHQPRGRQGAGRPGLRPHRGPVPLGHPLDGGRSRADLAPALGRPDAPRRRRRAPLRLRRAPRHPLADAYPLGQRPGPGPRRLGPGLEHAREERRRGHRPHHRRARELQGPPDRRGRDARPGLRGRPRPRLWLLPPGPERDLHRDPPVRRGLDRPAPRPASSTSPSRAAGCSRISTSSPGSGSSGPSNTGSRTSSSPTAAWPSTSPTASTTRRWPASSSRAGHSSGRSTAAGRPSSTTRRTLRRRPATSRRSTSTRIGAGPSSDRRSRPRPPRSSPASTAATPSRSPGSAGPATSSPIPGPGTRSPPPTPSPTSWPRSDPTSPVPATGSASSTGWRISRPCARSPGSTVSGRSTTRRSPRPRRPGTRRPGGPCWRPRPCRRGSRWPRPSSASSPGSWPP